MDAREKYKDRHQPVSIYETSLTAWENAQELVDYVKKLKYTHVELHPVMEYLNEDSGEYSTFAYYAPDRRFGMPEDFQQLVNALHKENIGVILDWTPSHFPREEGGLELLTVHRFMKIQIRPWQFIRCGELFYSILKVRWSKIFFWQMLFTGWNSIMQMV